MGYDEINDILAPYYNIQGTGIGDTLTYRDQYKNADLLLGKLNDIDTLDKKSAVYKDFAGRFKTQKANAVLGGVSTAAGALGQIGFNMGTAAQTADTSYFDDQVRRQTDFGNTYYGNFAQLQNDIANRPLLTPMSEKEIRGMNGWQKAFNIGSSALTGAMAGAKIGGPWGAVAGAAIGFLGGAGGVAVGDNNAKIKYAYNDASAERANAISDLNLGAAHERIVEKDSDTKAVRALSKGGSLKRFNGQVSMFRKAAPVNDIQKETVEDGIKIRIKR